MKITLQKSGVRGEQTEESAAQKYGSIIPYTLTVPADGVTGPPSPLGRLNITKIGCKTTKTLLWGFWQRCSPQAEPRGAQTIRHRTNAPRKATDCSLLLELLMSVIQVRLQTTS